ncbi:sugar phosphate isomerase/epimerase family protein [Arenibaculum sp.]|jgi:sugar phosphate isomerase/epimerase|uniref:sugar phosphate isomerase/epimerase family protein n=1 Tax=Arenibaculum sp. TaxID=2865862 RepID=UPI002E142A1E|nr:sugar phosphate isomerase/epimerase family protein [Arenibaculum sp.]
MRIALCNEVLRDMPFERQCAYAAALGYDGLEVAPFTLADDPRTLTGPRAAEIRRVAADHGLRITGLHWLLVAPEGLSVTEADAGVRAATLDMMHRLVDLCAALGGDVLVHGSPRQRTLPANGREEAVRRATDCFAAAGAAAGRAGVTYCIEPLSPTETNFVNTVAEAAALVEAIGEPALRTMIDTSAAKAAEVEAVEALLDRWLPTGLIAHVQVNDANRRGPGQGTDTFAPMFAALRRHGWDRTVAVEPFDYQPDGPGCAARAIGYVRGILEALP